MISISFVWLHCFQFHWNQLALFLFLNKKIDASFQNVEVAFESRMLQSLLSQILTYALWSCFAFTVFCLFCLKSLISYLGSLPCDRDFVKIYDGSSTRSPQLADLCGSQRPQTLQSSSNTMVVQLKTDHRRNFKGFSVSWKAARPVVVSDVKGKCW